jgi:hypothetical protein
VILGLVVALIAEPATGFALLTKPRGVANFLHVDDFAALVALDIVLLQALFAEQVAVVKVLVGVLALEALVAYLDATLAADALEAVGKLDVVLLDILSAVRAERVDRLGHARRAEWVWDLLTILKEPARITAHLLARSHAHNQVMALGSESLGVARSAQGESAVGAVMFPNPDGRGQKVGLALVAHGGVDILGSGRMTRSFVLHSNNYSVVLVRHDDEDADGGKRN